MFLTELHLFNFKNIEELQFSFDERITFFCGNNGVGKTNILDAIHYLSFTKSFLNSTDTENIQHNKDFFRIQGKYSIGEEYVEYSCVVTKEGRKQFRYFEKEYTRLYEHIGKVPLVLITPQDQMYIIEGSEWRRKLIDSMISQIDTEYLHSLVEYNRILKQRNSLLKSEQDMGIKRQLLDVYDRQLEAPCTLIYKKRKHFIDILSDLFLDQYATLTINPNEKAILFYKSQLNDASLPDLFKQNKEKDLLSEYTNAGIHKDDFIFTLNNMPIRYFASQGQQKSFLTALKLAYVMLLLNLGKKPIIMLDDIFDKLDDHRVYQLIHILLNTECQSFITHTSKQKIDDLLRSISKKVRIFELNNGKKM